jgi:transglutaminase-like putative cysteine protease
MLIRAGFQISYQCPAQTPMSVLLSVRPERLGDLATTQRIQAAPETPLRPYRDMFGNIGHRLVLPSGLVTLQADFVIEDSGLPDEVDVHAVAHPIAELPDHVLPYLVGSRYCETDLLSDMAWRLFGGTAPGWARVQAIVDYVHARLAFGYAHARPTRTALEAHEERRGVCRDFAHLSVALCRCMNIPARYCTGYLGDIGIPPVDAPMDFSAWFEAYLGGRWRTFDARHNTPRIGRIAMAYGRDAADVPISTSFGQAVLCGFKVVTEEIADHRAVLANVG